MERKFLIVTHKKLAEGFKDSLDFFTSVGKDIISISSYEDGKNEFPQKEVNEAVKELSEGNQLFILTDLLGGSVNQKCSQYITKKNVIVITGINLSLALALILEPAGKVSIQRVQKLINESKKQMILMNTFLNKDKAFDE